jgi:hypothetical protein
LGAGGARSIEKRCREKREEPMTANSPGKDCFSRGGKEKGEGKSRKKHLRKILYKKDQ